MQINYHKSYSYHLNRDMEFKVFGHAGIVLLAFPSHHGLQNGKTSMIASVRMKHISITFTKNYYHYSVIYIITKEKVKFIQQDAH